MYVSPTLPIFVTLLAYCDTSLASCYLNTCEPFNRASGISIPLAVLIAGLGNGPRHRDTSRWCCGAPAVTCPVCCPCGGVSKNWGAVRNRSSVEHMSYRVCSRASETVTPRIVPKKHIAMRSSRSSKSMSFQERWNNGRNSDGQSRSILVLFV